jgi:deoxycytidylate deaminase
MKYEQEVLESLEPAIVEATRAARMSPCQKSKRGAAVFHIDVAGILLGDRPIRVSNNHPAQGGCDGSQACRDSCSMRCVHAEQAVLLKTQGGATTRRDVLHVKVNGAGEVVPSGVPSCWQCSKLMLEAGISGVWLYHEAGWRRYEAEDFHRKTLEHCEIYTGES